MAKKMLIDATHPEETRVVVADGNKVEEFDFESVNKRQLAGNIYLAKVTRVEPSLQAAFVDYGGNRHGFLAFSEIHPDYYQIPVADREALLAEEAAYAAAQADRDETSDDKPKSKRRRKPKSAAAKSADAVTTGEIPGMDVVDLEEAGAEAETADETDGAPQAADADARPGPDSAGDTDGEEADGDADEAAPQQPSGDIETVAEEEDEEEIRPRKPRPRRYKIQEVIKVRQILLVQVVKEERGNKGAALTTYLSLAGRYCVLMPNTARGGGISRKITNATDRKRLKSIAQEMEVPQGAGLIVRTAGSERTKAEIKRDYEYLMRQWEEVRELTLRSIAPAPIYEEGNLIKRSIRDLYTKEVDEVVIEGDEGYRVAKDFMKMLMPSHAKKVKHYTDPMPLFARYQVESYLGAMFNPTVQLKSGGYIVIGVTEALVAIDVNSGRATKEGSIEETALKTNLEAAEEIARQLRLRDLAGLIVIDFIDMEDRRNNASVERRFKDKLKSDRARIQVGRISGFGLMEMSRQRLRPGMIEATTTPCPHCHGTGLIRSNENLALTILREVEEEATRRRSREVLVRAPVSVANYLINQKREHIAGIEARYGISIRVEGDPFLISPDYEIEKFKTATRAVPEPAQPVVSVDTIEMASDEPETDEDDTGDEGDGSGKKKRRRRRRGGRGRNKNRQNDNDRDTDDDSEDEAADGDSTEAEPSKAASPEPDDASDAVADADAVADDDAAPEAKPAKKAGSSRSKSSTEKPAAKSAAKPKSSGSRSKAKAKAEPEPKDEPDTAEAVTEEPAIAAEPAPEPAPEPEPVAVVEPAAAPEPAPEPAANSDEAAKPKRRGWWSRG